MHELRGLLRGVLVRLVHRFRAAEVVEDEPAL